MLIKKLPPIKYANAETTALVDFGNNQHRDVKDVAYGATGNGATDDAPAIQAALNDLPYEGGIVYIPPGTYRVASPIVFPADRQARLIGAGPEATRLVVPSGTTATPGIIHIRGSELRSSVEYLQILFQQPETTNRADLTQYVPALYAQNIARFRIQHVRIVLAWVGIDLRGNSNCEINDLEMSHFHTGIWIDGSLDSIRIAHLHDWPFGMSPALQTIMAEPVNTALRIGRADGVHVTNALFHCGTSVRMTTSATTTGAGIVHLTNCGFDTYGGVIVEAGTVRISDSGFGIRTVSNYTALTASPSPGAVDASVQMTNCYLLSDAGTAPLIDLRGVAGGGWLEVNITNCIFRTGNGNQSSIRADAAAGGVIHATLTDNHFHRTGNIAYTAPTIALGVNVRATVAHNLTLDKGSGVGDFLAVTGAGQRTVSENVLQGWGLNYTAPAQPWGGNNVATTLTGTSRELLGVAGFVQASGLAALDPVGMPPFAVRRYTGSLDGTGAAAVPHAMSTLYQTGLIVQAWYKGGGGAMGPLTIAAIDGSNIHISGGPASTPYRVVVLYSSNAHAW